MATPVKITAMQRISGKFNFVPSQSHSISAANGAVRHCMSSTVRRLPSRGRAWKYAVSPRPMPKSPLNINHSGAPAKPAPNVNAQIVRKIVASVMRQKFASSPPICFAVR